MGRRSQQWRVISETASPGFVARIARQHLTRLLSTFDPDAVRRRLTGVSSPLGAGGLTWSTIEAHVAETALRNQIELLTDLLAEGNTGLLITLDEIHRSRIAEVRELAVAISTPCGRSLSWRSLAPA